MGEPKPIEVLVEWRRWTIGVAWQSWYDATEISIQLPVVALSIYIKHE